MKLCLTLLQRFLVKERIFPLKSNILVVDDLLSTADKEISSRLQTFLELTEDFILCLLRKVNEHIPTHYQMEICGIDIL